MPDPIAIPLPARAAMRKLGSDLRDARRRRRFSVASMAERMFVSRDTVWRMEKGDPGVGLGSIATALFVLCMTGRLANLADQTEDLLGLDIDRENLPQRIRTRKAGTRKDRPSQA